MNVKPHIILGFLFVGLGALGSLQGNRIDRLQDSELFYRWILNGATQMRIEGTLVFDDSVDLPEAMDDVLFLEMSAMAETRFPDFPIDDSEDYGEDGQLLSKLIRAVRLEEDDLIWQLAISDEASEIETRFHEWVATSQIRSVPTKFNMALVYDEQNPIQGVGVTSMFFGLRKVAANFTWLQVDKYWHLGEQHKMVPLMRTCVALDPNFVDAYLLGSWHLAYNITAKLPETPEPQKVWNDKYKKRLGAKEEWYYIAADFLKDGIRNNHRDYRLYFDLGYSIFENKLKDHHNAVVYLNEARRHKHDKWVPRMLYLAMMRNGQYEDAIEGWEDYLTKFPGHLAGMRSIRLNKAYLAEVMSAEAFECSTAAREAGEEALRLAAEARAAGNLAVAGEREEEARKAVRLAEEMDGYGEIEKATALSIWQPMYEREGDPLANARILRFQALDYAQQERYREAISVLEVARFESGEVFEESSELIMDIKKKAGFSLTISERLAIERENEAAQYREEPEAEPKRRMDCAYLAE